jgi:plasmid stabilization system protein ParE
VIRADKPTAASNFRRKAEDVLRRLEDYPESGHPIREYPDSPFRQVIVKPYRFFYRVQEDVVWVVGVWHSAQLPDEP